MMTTETLVGWQACKKQDTDVYDILARLDSKQPEDMYFCRRVDTGDIHLLTVDWLQSWCTFRKESLG